MVWQMQLAKNVVGRPADRGSASRDLRVDLQPSATESTSEVGQHDVSVSLACFDSEPGSIPVGAIVETGTAWGRAGCWEPAVLFLPANTARYLVGISVGIGSYRR
jgi:hypothetical protein